jgi:hypothetical protein
MKRILFSCLFILLSLTAFTQVRYSIDPKIEQIQSDYIKAWEKVDKIDGYRIQITAFSGNNSRNRAEGERAAFKSNFPGISVYLSYSEPYFKLRVGNYLTRLEAYKDLKRIQLTYPNAYIVPDKINFND